MDSDKYKKHMADKEEEFESLCRRCGECCGSSDEPCQNLAKKDDGTFFCKDYENRLGPQKTTSGKFFNCILIRGHVAKDSLRPNCAYRAVNC